MRLRGFWLTLVLGAVLLLAPLVAIARLDARSSPARPAFPMPGRLFVAEYSGTSAYLAHLLYYWDLLGFGERIRSAEVLLLGTSHMQFGLSAEILSHDLSRSSGRHVRVYNAALGCTASLDFATDILRRVGARSQLVVADVYAMEAYFDPCMYEFFGISDAGQAAVKVATVWTRFDLDWLFDGLLPKVELRDDGVQIKRYLNKGATLLDWKTGDVVEQYGASGSAFPRTPPRSARPVLGDPDNVVSWKFDNDRMRPLGQIAELQHQGSSLVLTLIPYAADESHQRGSYGVVDDLLRRGKPDDAPFVAISADKLETFDGFHLTGPSRGIATERLLRGIAQAGYLGPFRSRVGSAR